MQARNSPGALADLVGAYLDISPDEKQEILETIDLAARLDKVSRAAGPTASRCCG